MNKRRAPMTSCTSSVFVFFSFVRLYFSRANIDFQSVTRNIQGVHKSLGIPTLKTNERIRKNGQGKISKDDDSVDISCVLT